MIKAIIFDLGSVIYKTDWKKLDCYFRKLNNFGEIKGQGFLRKNRP